MASRQDELQAKRARLAELKRQRELRDQDPVRWRQSIGTASSDPVSSQTSSQERRAQVDELVNNLIGSSKEDIETSQSKKTSRHYPTFSPPRGTSENGTTRHGRAQTQSVSTQTLSSIPTATVFEVAPDPVPRKEYIAYSKGVQTDLATFEDELPQDGLEIDSEALARKRQSRDDEGRDEELRIRLRSELEEELKAKAASSSMQFPLAGQQRYLVPTLEPEQLTALTSSNNFLSFLERSSKVIERALDDDHDLLADYTSINLQEDVSDDENTLFSGSSRRLRGLKQTQQFFDPNQGPRRQISDLQFSPHFLELLLSSHTKKSGVTNDPSGLIMLWNVHAPSRPEYIFHNHGSDIMSARFSPFHPNLVLGGCYTGQVCLWDTRATNRTGGAPVLKTPQSGSHLGHNHPIYSLSIIGTPNAHNILTASSDGVVCSWSVDMLTQPQEYLELVNPPPARTDDLAPTSMAYPSSDPTFFVVGTEEGTIYPCHRYDRAGAKAGIDTKLAYKGHTAPVMSSQFHLARGPVDLSDLLLTSSVDWSVKLWRVRPAGSSSTVVANNASTPTTMGGPQVISPILDMGRDDLVYDAKWAPHKPSIFACVTGAGDLEIFDLNVDLEVPIARASPTRGKGGTLVSGLNKCAWEEKRGGLVATGGLDGVVSLFEVGKELSGEGRLDEWTTLKKAITRLEAAKS